MYCDLTACFTISACLWVKIILSLTIDLKIFPHHLPSYSIQYFRSHVIWCNISNIRAMFKRLRVAKTICRIMNAMISVWLQKDDRIFVLGPEYTGDVRRDSTGDGSSVRRNYGLDELWQLSGSSSQIFKSTLTANFTCSFLSKYAAIFSKTWLFTDFVKASAYCFFSSARTSG